MHQWECEEVVTRFESFARCIAAESRASRLLQHPLIIFSDNFQQEKRRD